MEGENEVRIMNIDRFDSRVFTVHTLISPQTENGKGPRTKRHVGGDRKASEMSVCQTVVSIWRQDPDPFCCGNVI